MTSLELIAHARSFLYVREVGSNSGPEIDPWLKRVGQPPGVSWCSAFACCMVNDVDPDTQLRSSASALHLLANNHSLTVDLQDIQPGDIVIEDHGKGLGHVSIATSVIRVSGSVAGLTTIAGNTSADGHSRNGDRVAEHPHDLPDPRIVGVLRFCNDAA